MPESYAAGFLLFVVIVGVWMFALAVFSRGRVYPLDDPAHREELRAYGVDVRQVVGRPHWVARDAREEDYADAT